RVAALKQARASSDPSRCPAKEAGDGPAGCRLAAAALADQAEDFSTADIERHTINRDHSGIAFPEHRNKILDRKKLFHCRQPLGRKRLSRPSPIKVKAMPV